MSSLSVNHVGLCVSDLEKSLEFYVGIAGFEVYIPAYDMSGEWFDVLTRNQDSEITVVMLRLGEVVLQLVRYNRGGGDFVGGGHNRPGNFHFCINVDDVDEVHRAVTETGLYEPTAIVDIMGLGIRSFYTTDPDGTPVEFLKMP